MDQDRLQSTFLDLVRIDAPSLHEAAVAAYCRRAFEEAGCSVTIDGTAAITGSDTGNVIATLPGTCSGKVLYVAHMDCAQPCRGVKPIVRDGQITSDGTTVLGGDDKVGVASIIEMMRTLSASTRPHPTVVGFLTVGEEAGLKGSRAIGEDLFDGELCLVLDSHDAPGIVTIGAPAHYSFTARFEGRAAHAGVVPELGVSAIEMAASAISAMELGRLDERTTANVGTIVGGSADNVVADSCIVSGECRSIDRERLEEVRAAIDEAMMMAADVHGGEVEANWDLEYDGFLLDEGDESVRLLEQAALDCGLEAGATISGDGTDANVLGSKGCVPLVMGTGVADSHTTAEHIAVRDVEDTCRLAIAVAYRLGERG